MTTQPDISTFLRALTVQRPIDLWPTWKAYEEPVPYEVTR